MWNNRKSRWKRLDNAAKIFPALASVDDSEVFRLSCQLKEEVDPQLLQKALDDTIAEFPSFTDTISRGLFWYYLEDSGKHPVIHEECSTPMQPLYNRNTHGLLIDVSYYKCRVHLEVFHALCDGTGAIIFFRTLIAHYLCLVHKLPYSRIDLGIDLTEREKSADSFSQYYEKESKRGNGLGLDSFLGRKTQKRIYRFSEEKTPDFRQLVTEGETEVEAVRKVAKYYNTTVTIFLCAVLIASIFDTMDPHDRQKAVSIAIPVNLRKYFASNTLRNFFGMIHVVHDFEKHGTDFESVISHVASSFEKELTRENLAKKIASQVWLEKNIGIRILPLFIKNIAMYISQRESMKRRTICLSNVGRIDMPEEIASYVDTFLVYNSSALRQICICSFRENMNIAFSGALAEHDVERAFFRRLAKLLQEKETDGILTISANYSAKEFEIQ